MRKIHEFLRIARFLLGGGGDKLVFFVPRQFSASGFWWENGAGYSRILEFRN